MDQISLGPVRGSFSGVRRWRDERPLRKNSRRPGESVIIKQCVKNISDHYLADTALPSKERLTIRHSLLLALALATAGLSAPAHAATWHVPSECPTIQAGVDSAAAGDTVRVACGTYYEHDISMKSGVCLTSETGDADCVTIDALQMGRVIYCLNVDDAASVVGFTITGGIATGAAEQDSAGGGIYCEDSYPTLSNCSFVDNAAYLVGGGLFTGEDVSAALPNLRLQHDTGPLPTGRVSQEITDCTFSGNIAWGGGGMCAISYSPALTRCTFSNNNAEERGGGIYCGSDDSSFVDCAFVGNQAYTGGGAFISAWSNATFADCSFLHNTATRHGGAVRTEQYADPTFTNVTFTRNVSVGSGGAVYCEDGSASFDYVEFRSNTAGGSGGGMRCSLHASTTITNATFYDNVSARGSGLYVSDWADVTVGNCIIAFGGDVGSAVECNSLSGHGVALSACNVYGNGAGDWVECIADQGTIDGNFSADPLFCHAELGDLTLYADSPCLPGNHPEGGDYGLIGAWSAGCSATGIAAETTVQTSWGAIKATYR